MTVKRPNDPLDPGASAELIVIPEAVPAVRLVNGAITLFPLCTDQRVPALAEFEHFLNSPVGEFAVRCTVFFAELLPNRTWKLLGSGVLIEPNIVATAGHVLHLLRPDQTQRISLRTAFVHFVPVMDDGTLRSAADLAPDDFAAVPVFGARCRRSESSDIAAVELSRIPARARPLQRGAFGPPVQRRQAMLLATPDPRELVPTTHRFYRICDEHGLGHIDPLNLRIARGVVGPVINPNTRLFLHRANSHAGTSGGPMFDLESGRLIGLNIQGTTGSTSNSGVSIEALLPLLS